MGSNNSDEDEHQQWYPCHMTFHVSVVEHGIILKWLI